MRNLENTVNNIRSFNRLYTNMLGLLDKHMLDTEFSLTEIRILYEIANNDNCTAGMLVKLLKVDKSYLSRIISKFVKKNLIFKEFSDQNSRVAILELTNSGKKIVDEMNEKSSKQITKLISNLDDNDYAEIDQAINTLKKKLLFSTGLIKIRPFEKSDISLLISEQTNLFDREYGYSSKVWKSYVKDAVESFVNNFDETKECMYVLDYESEILGNVAIANVDKDTAQLRFFYTNSKLRGIGAGTKLIDLAIQFCRDKNYKKIILWTANNLIPARKLYSYKGFELVDMKANDGWGQEGLIEEKWLLEL